ncbi:hypothetical protein AKJ16_DCAP27180 [Drosera capensis]
MGVRWPIAGIGTNTSSVLAISLVLVADRQTNAALLIENCLSGFCPRMVNKYALFYQRTIASRLAFRTSFIRMEI